MPESTSASSRGAAADDAQRSYERIASQLEQMLDAARNSSDKVLLSPSALWSELIARDLEVLRKHGFNSFKRTVNFHYHQWGVFSPLDPKLWRLAFQFLRRYGRPKVAPAVKVEEPAGELADPLRHPLARFVYRWFV